MGEPREVIKVAARPLFDGGRRPQVVEIARAAGVSKATFYRHFRSRDELETELDVEPGRDGRERVLEAALELMSRQGLAALSMDELADKAGLSRASLYRLFPGKPALFTAIIRAYSPLEPVTRALAELHSRPPEEVMPEVARIAARTLKGRVGLVRTVLLEVTSGNPDTADAVELLLVNAVGGLVGYVLEQMQVGRLRMMHPLIALQAFIGPIFFHLVTREIAEQKLGLQISPEDAAAELAAHWLKAMTGAPEKSPDFLGTS